MHPNPYNPKALKVNIDSMSPPVLESASACTTWLGVRYGLRVMSLDLGLRAWGSGFTRFLVGGKDVNN